MSDDQMKQDRMQALKERRMRFIEAKDNAEKRSKLGDSIVNKINEGLKTELTLELFNTEKIPPIGFLRKPNFKDCPGLVAAHTNEPRAREILNCCDGITGKQDGLVSCDEYGFVGTASVESISYLHLLDAAKLLHDSILFWPDGSDSIVLVDHYKVQGVLRDVGFSIVIQGEKLESELASCFKNVVHLSA